MLSSIRLNPYKFISNYEIPYVYVVMCSETKPVEKKKQKQNNRSDKDSEEPKKKNKNKKLFLSGYDRKNVLFFYVSVRPSPFSVRRK